MKRWKRLLAMLLAALMLSGMWSALAELELEFVEPESGGVEPDEGLALNEELASPIDLELPDLEQEAPIDADASLEVSTKGRAEPIQTNDDRDFRIEGNILVEYTGPGGDVVIPDGISTIGQKAFSENNSLTSVVIPDSVTSIETEAFDHCTYLTRVAFGKGLT